MKFSDFFENEDPAYEIFRTALATVFDEGDATTEHIERLSDESRLVYLLWSFDGEVHNGGFDQLFINSLGDYSLEILQALETVHARISHDLLSQVLTWFPDSMPSKDRQLRWKQYQEFGESEAYQSQADQLDSAFYKYEDNLAALINSYVQLHPNAVIAV